MSENLGDTLKDLDLSIETAGPPPGAIPGERWWCFWGCLGTGCHGLTNSAQYCPNGDCSSTACNNNTSQWTQNCHGAGCDNAHLNFDNGIGQHMRFEHYPGVDDWVMTCAVEV